MFADFYINFKETLEYFYQQGFQEIDFPAEIEEYKFKTEDEITTLYKTIRDDNNFSFPYKYISSYNPVNKELMYDSDIVCNYSLKLSILKQSVFEVAITRSLFHWVILHLPYKNGSVWEKPQFTENKKNSEDLYIVLIQILTWHSIKNDKYLLEAFEILNNKQKSEVYNKYTLLKSRSLDEIISDLIALRKMNNFSFNEWNKLIGENLL